MKDSVKKFIITNISLLNQAILCRSKFHDDDSSSFDDDNKHKRMISRLSQQVQDQV